jgi:aspartyl-tRNA(Asn)/glutamyl-tRNA(Gln) amidotransferase subunit C
MAVGIDDVRHIASLARLGLTPERAEALVTELNTILEHMDVLSRVDTSAIEPMAAVSVQGAPLRADAGPATPLFRQHESFAPRTEDGFFLVPRLSTHEDPTTS